MPLLGALVVFLVYLSTKSSLLLRKQLFFPGILGRTFNGYWIKYVAMSSQVKSYN